VKRISVFGMGYVGCVTAACLSRDGHHVIGVDIDRDKIAVLEQGGSPVSEPGLSELICEQVETGRLKATTDVNEAVDQSDLALVTVGTPSAGDGSVESHAVERVVHSVGRRLRDHRQPYTIVIRSTLLPGILEERLAPMLAEAAGCELGSRLHLCNHPEFLRETTAIADYDDPPFILVGADQPAGAESVFELYEAISAERLVTDTRTAALVKYACNAFHALKIGFANEVGTLSREFGADGQDVMRLLCRDTRLNISPAYLRPGFAFGGSCLPKDVRALTRFAQQRAVRTELLNAILPSNEAHIDRALRRVQAAGSKKIGLVGLSFKAGTDDLRESPLVALAETLLGRGFDLRIYDPGVRVGGLTGTNRSYVDVHLPHLAALLVDTPAALYEHAGLLVLGTNIADELDDQAGFTGEILDLRRDLVAAAPPAALVAQ
jgi:GDP-mannose 6-dehydrogenase